MPSFRKQRAKARKSREMDIWSDYGNLDVMLGEGSSNSLIKRELNDALNGPEGQQDSESVPDRECSAQENEIRNTLASVHDRLAEYIEILSGEMVA